VLNSKIDCRQNRRNCADAGADLRPKCGRSIILFFGGSLAHLSLLMFFDDAFSPVVTIKILVGLLDPRLKPSKLNIDSPIPASVRQG